MSSTVSPSAPADALRHLEEAIGETLDDAMAQAVRSSLPAQRTFAEVESYDGARLRACALGEPRERAVVIASACGGPLELSEPWIRRLAWPLIPDQA